MATDKHKEKKRCPNCGQYRITTHGIKASSVVFGLFFIGALVELAGYIAGFFSHTDFVVMTGIGLFMQLGGIITIFNARKESREHGKYLCENCEWSGPL